MAECNGKKVWHIGERTENCYAHGDKWGPINTLRLENLVFRHPAKTIGGLNTGVRHNIIAYDYQLFLLFTACSTLRRCFRNIFRYCSLQGCTPIKLFSSYVARGAIVRCDNQVKKKSDLYFSFTLSSCRSKSTVSANEGLMGARYDIWASLWWNWFIGICHYWIKFCVVLFKYIQRYIVRRDRLYFNTVLKNF